MSALRNLIAEFDNNVNYEGQCKVQSFDLIYTPHKGDPQVFHAKESLFKGEILNCIKSAHSGDLFLIDNIKVRAPFNSCSPKIFNLSFKII